MVALKGKMCTSHAGLVLRAPGQLLVNPQPSLISPQGDLQSLRRGVNVLYLWLNCMEHLTWQHHSAHIMVCCCAGKQPRHTNSGSDGGAGPRKRQSPRTVSLPIHIIADILYL